MGIVFPEPAAIKTLAAKHSLSGSDEEVCNAEVVKKHFLDEVNALGKEKGLKGFEQVLLLLVQYVNYYL